MSTQKFLVKYVVNNGFERGEEVYAYDEFEATSMILSKNTNTYIKRVENLSKKEERERQAAEWQQKKISKASSTSSEKGTSIFSTIGFLIKLALFAIAALIVLKIALYLMVVWEFLLYILVIVGFMVLIVKLKNNARKVSMVFAAIAIPFMIFRMTQLVDDYKEHFANEEKLQLERAEQKAKESKKTPTHEKAVSKEQKPVKNTGSN